MQKNLHTLLRKYPEVPIPLQKLHPLTVHVLEHSLHSTLDDLLQLSLPTDLEAFEKAILALRVYSQFWLSTQYKNTAYPEDLASLLPDAWNWIVFLTLMYQPMTSTFLNLFPKGTSSEAHTERLTIMRVVLSSVSIIVQSALLHPASAECLFASKFFLHVLLHCMISPDSTPTVTNRFVDITADVLAADNGDPTGDVHPVFAEFDRRRSGALSDALLQQTGALCRGVFLPFGMTDALSRVAQYRVLFMALLADKDAKDRMRGTQQRLARLITSITGALAMLDDPIPILPRTFACFWIWILGELYPAEGTSTRDVVVGIESGLIPMLARVADEVDNLEGRAVDTCARIACEVLGPALTWPVVIRTLRKDAKHALDLRNVARVCDKWALFADLCLAFGHANEVKKCWDAEVVVLRESCANPESVAPPQDVLLRSRILLLPDLPESPLARRAQSRFVSNTKTLSYEMRCFIRRLTLSTIAQHAPKDIAGMSTYLVDFSRSATPIHYAGNTAWPIPCSSLKPGHVHTFATFRRDTDVVLLEVDCKPESDFMALANGKN
ncbi:hypothetical protein HDZ31DRAFT_60527 [Schizophyllum fasciatum]